MKGFLFSGILALISILPTFGQTQNHPDQRPKLVIGLVVDQMRQEYFYKFQERFTEGGFKRLMKEGFMMKNAHYNYIPTYTGPGHASVFTGTTPATHGVIGNDWYVKSLGKTIYCASDSTVRAVGGSEQNGKISPRNLLTTTISDELMFASNKRSKVVGIAIKDRGAAFPAGHMGDAYWYDSKTGNFMTSSYYHEMLPTWAKAFNDRKRADHFLSQSWKTLFPIESYTQSIADDNPYESPFMGMSSASFPYNLPELMEDNGGYGLLATTPFGNTLSWEMAYAAIEGEQLGKRGETDLLSISFSSPDYIGHRFGPTSVEVEDNYLRLDREMEQFLNYLDKEYGEGQYLIFLTADHGVADVVNYLQSERVPSGLFNNRFVLTQMRGFAQEHYGEGNWILNFSNEQVFLNHNLAMEKGLDFEKMQREIADFLMRFPGIKEVYTAMDLRRNEYQSGRKNLLQMGYNHKASGDLLLILEPSWLGGTGIGTTHGTGYTYDTHVPILFFGWNISQGESSRYTNITDIAPTLAILLHTKLPNGATGQPILEIVDEK